MSDRTGVRPGAHVGPPRARRRGQNALPTGLDMGGPKRQQAELQNF